MAVTRICLYTRISTDEENQPTSLHSQRERLEAFCKAQEGWHVVPHQEDRATGTKLGPPGLQAALELARDGGIDPLLVYRVDRLSRKVRQLAEELDAYQVVLRSATEPFDTGSAAGRMMLQMLAVFAEFEHATIVDRVSAGIERRAKEGRWFAGRPPFGYLFSDELRTLVPDPVKAPVVRRSSTSTRATGWARSRSPTSCVKRMRPHPRPAGDIRPCTGSSATRPTRAGSAGATASSRHPRAARRRADLPARAGDPARARRRTSPAVAATPPTSSSPASSAAAAATRPYVGMSARGNGGRYEYYACSGRQKHGPKACRNERLPRQKLEHAVLQQLASLYRDGELVAEALAQAEQEAERTRPEIEQWLASIGAEIVRAEQALERYYEAFEQGKLSPERCDERLTRLQARLEDLHAQRGELTLPTPDEAGRGPTPADLAAVADQLERVIAEGEPQKAKALRRLLIQELRVNGRAKIQPTYRLVTPEVCATSEKVERTGIEPVTSGLQRQ